MPLLCSNSATALTLRHIASCHISRVSGGIGFYSLCECDTRMFKRTKIFSDRLFLERAVHLLQKVVSHHRS